MPIPAIFDGIIWGLLGLGLFVQMIILTLPFLRNSKKAFYFFVFIFICQIVVLYGSFVEPRMITIERHVVVFEKGRIMPQTHGRYFIPKKTPERENKEDIRIALIADWQVGPYKQDDYVERAVRHIERLAPDLILMPGDFVYLSPEEMTFLEPLKEITSQFPTYASLGNHDYNWREQHHHMPVEDIPDEFLYSHHNMDTLESYGVRVLHNSQETLTIGTKTVNLVGQEDWWATAMPLLKDFYTDQSDATNDEDLTIFLQHNPDGAFFQDIPDDIDLMVAGHTHGGQIRLPFIGPPHPLSIRIGNIADRGWFSLKNPEQLLYITQGMGESGPRTRLLAWPEIVVFDIKI